MPATADATNRYVYVYGTNAGNQYFAIGQKTAPMGGFSIMYYPTVLERYQRLTRGITFQLNMTEHTSRCG